MNNTPEIHQNNDQHTDIQAQNLILTHARLLDPIHNIDEAGTLTISNGQIQNWQPNNNIIQNKNHFESIDLKGAWITPHFIDLGAQLREPGFEHKGTLLQESKAAYSAGFSSICMLPDTQPVMDSTAVIGLIRERAAVCPVHILPLAAMTIGLKGNQLSEIFALKEAGCIAITQSRAPMRDNRLALRCLEYVATTGLTVFFYSQDDELAGDGCAHEGPIADKLGLPAIPECAETTAIARDLIMVEKTGITAHFGHISSARGIAMIEEAQAKGLPVTADVALTHLAFDESALLDFNPQFYLQPPLRSQTDRLALLDSVNRGTLSISISHQPQDIAAKTAPFSESEPGMSLYDTHIALAQRLIDAGELNALAWVKALSTAPASVIHQHLNGLNIGDIAAFNIISDHQWTPNKQNCHSLGGNILGFRELQKGKLQYRVTGLQNK